MISVIKNIKYEKIPKAKVSENFQVYQFLCGENVNLS